MSKFCLANATPGKRAAEDSTTGPSPMKIPKVAQLKKEPPREKNDKITTNGPLNICVYKYSDCAADMVKEFKDIDDTPFYQIQMDL